VSKPFSAYRGDGPYTFVCYAHEDADVVYPELAWLRDQGINIWYDEGISAGTNWRASIGDSLMHADRVLFYLSHASLVSDHCNREVNLALDESKELVPVYLETLELTSDLKVGLNRVQALHREKDTEYRQHLLGALGSQSIQTIAGSVDSRFGTFGRRRVRLLNALAMGLVIVALGVLIGAWSTTSSISASVERRFGIDLGPAGNIYDSGTVVPSEIAISPDGARFAYTVPSVDVYEALYVRDLDSIDASLLWPKSVLKPAFSPDGQWVVFYTWMSDGTVVLMKVSVATGRSQTVVRAFPPRGAAWLPDDTIIHVNNIDFESGALFRVSAAGGTPVLVVPVDLQAGEQAHSQPSALPGGEHILFTVSALTDTTDPASAVSTHLALLNLASSEYVTLIENARTGQYAASGHIVFVREGGVWAIPFDEDRLQIVGAAALIELNVADAPDWGNRPVVIAGDGSALVVPAPAEVRSQQRPVWVDRYGRVQPSSMPDDKYDQPRVSPDGKRIVFARGASGEEDLWIHDLERPGSLLRMTFDDAMDTNPVWGADGTGLFFGSTRNGQFNMYHMRSDGAGSPEQLIQSPLLQAPTQVTPDGASLIYAERGTESSWDIGAYPLSGTGDAQIIFRTAFAEGTPSFSPDGRWMVYASNESGASNVYVRPYPDLESGKWQISTEGGGEALWSPKGEEIFYRNGGAMLAVPVTTTPTFRPGLPTVLFEGDYYRGPTGSRQYSVSYADGEKFLMLENLSEERTAQLIYVDNWFAKLERLAPHP
jgi:Tol biopolymer transport system component